MPGGKGAYWEHIRLTLGSVLIVQGVAAWGGLGGPHMTTVRGDGRNLDIARVSSWEGDATSGGAEASPDWSDYFLTSARTPVLIVAERDRRGVSERSLAQIARALGHRVLGCVPLAAAQARLASMVDVGAVILSCAGMEPEVQPLIEMLDATARTSAMRLIVIVDLVGLDRVHALVETPDVIILCEPRPEEVLMALGGLMHQDDRVGLDDSRGEEGESSYERLNDQLMRLSRMVETLMQHRPSDGLMLWPEAGAPAAFQRPTPIDAAVDSAADFPVTGTQVRALLRARRLRDHIFVGDLFADPAWDILLDLIAARLEQTRVSVSSLCIAAAVPPTTALRWIRHLTERGLLQREADPVDGRRIFVGLSSRGTDAMMRWLRDSRALLAAAAGIGEATQERTRLTS